MIDYLSGLAEQATTPSSTVRPTLRPPYADRPIDTSDSRFDDTSSLDGFIDVESPTPWSGTKASRSKEVGDVSGDGQGILAPTEQSAFRQMLGRSQKVERLSARNSASDFAIPNELRNPNATSRQQLDVTVPPIPRVESNLSMQSERTTPIEVQRQAAGSSKLASDDSDSRRDHQISGKNGLQFDSRTGHDTDKGVLSPPRHVKPILAEQQAFSGGIVNSAVEIHSEQESVLPLHRPQTGRRANEIVPLSATSPLPVLSVRSQPVSSPIVQPVAETIVHVTIGRVEVRATVGPQKPVAGREPSSRRSSQSLEDYLQGNSSGRSS